MKNYVALIVVTVCIVVLAGCFAAEIVEPGNSNGTDISTKIPSATPTLTVQMIQSTPTSDDTAPGVAATKQLEPVQTPTPSRPPSPTSTPTVTPVVFPTFDVATSTLSEEAATQNLIELLETNGGCELPCWWGIVPGETNVESIEPTFVPLGFDWYRDYEELNGNTLYSDYIEFSSEAGVIQTILVYGGAGEETYDHNEAWRPYAILRILERLGTPEQLYVYYPFRFDPGGMQAYRLFMYYPELGVEIDYLGKAKPLDENPQWARACPNILETDEINLFLFQPGTVPDYLEQTLPESSLGFIPREEGEMPYDLVDWEQATGRSLDEFVRLFTENSEGGVCFDFKTYWTGN
jgi:hypothetical protein